jgi:tetratricopeptide (TPR) repeat protein
MSTEKMGPGADIEEQKERGHGGVLQRVALPCAVIAACAVLAFAGCRNETPPKSASPSAEAPKAVALSTDKQLALAATKDNGLIDRELAMAAKVAQRSPEKLEPWIALGEGWVRKARETSDPGYYAHANACVNIALQISPGDRLALNLKALVLLNNHKFKEAREVAQSIVAAHPTDPMGYGSLADAELELGNVEASAAATQRMMDIKPNLPSYSRMSFLQWMSGRDNEAIAAVRVAIDAAGDKRDAEPRAWTLVQAAMIFWHRGDYEGADAGFLQATQVVRDYPPALVGRGRVAMARGDHAGAARLFAQAHAQSPLVETAWLLGDARAAAGDPKGAEEAWAIAKKEGTAADPRSLSMMLSAHNQSAPLALELAEREAHERGDIVTEDALAFALYRNGRHQEAKQHIDRARRFGTKDARLMFHQGAIYLANGDKKNGKKLIEGALAQNPKFDVEGEREARELLARN